MKTISVSLLVCVLYVLPVHAQIDGFELTLSGTLADKLEPGTRLSVWNPSPSTKQDWAEFRVEDLPYTLPFGQFTGHAWHVNFSHPSEPILLFSITLSPDLFDKPRPIDIKLNRPTPRIRPTFSHDGDVHYAAGITKRMRYRDLPYWDKELARFIPSRPPSIQIIRHSDGIPLQNSVMEMGCFASKWWASIDESIDLGRQMELTFSVRYDSGGLFEPIETTLDFAYRASDHGWGRAEPGDPRELPISREQDR